MMKTQNDNNTIESNVEFDSLHESFDTNIRFKARFEKNSKSVLYFARDEYYHSNPFADKVHFYMNRTYVAYIKVGFANPYGELTFRMAGSQFVSTMNSLKDVELMRLGVIERINELSTSYGSSLGGVDRIVITFIPVNLNLVARYRLEDSADKQVLRDFIKNNFSTKTVVPVSVRPKILGGELHKVVHDGKITEVRFIDGSGVDVRYMTKPFEFDGKLSKISPNFKFYLCYLNSHEYILGVHYISKNSVRKIRINKIGMVMEDIIDTVLEDGTVKRVKGNNVIILKGDRVIKAYKDINLVPIKNVYKNNIGATENPNIGVIDCETFKDSDGVQKVYLAGFKTNLEDKVHSYYIDKNNINNYDVIVKLVDELLRSKYNGITFYCHNLGNYDVLFMLKALTDYNTLNEGNKDYKRYELNFTFRGNEILSIAISKNNNRIIIKDSYAMLGQGLRNLSKVYECSYQKSYFPYKFSVVENLYYEGVTPDISYYEDISLDNYREMYSENWSFKDESVKYLNSDLDTHFEVMTKVNKHFFLEYDLDMTKSTTISGLALKLFLTNYYKNNIPSITKKSLYKDLKQAYYGGITEVYKPYGENLFYYDINSLYPYAALNAMPGLKAQKILSFDSDIIPFGFHYVSVDCTLANNKFLGLLPHRKDGLTFPLGKWEGWYFSEELRFAQSMGYKITIHHGYCFDKVENVFDEYVKNIYKRKVEAVNSTQKALSKSLLNNLLGRFGIDLEKYETKFITDEKLEEILMIRTVKAHTRVGDQNLVSYSAGLDYKLINSLGLDINKVLEKHTDYEINSSNISSVAISAAINSYARIIITKHKLDILERGGELYYSDTDSIVTDKELPKDLVSNVELGKFKLEHKISKGVFISGKTYCLTLSDGEVIRKAKGAESHNLTYEDYIDLLNNKTVTGVRKSSIKHYETGSVDIINEKLLLRGDSYIKRTKLLDENGKWFNTIPLFINEIDYSLIPYSKPVLSLTISNITKPPNIPIDLIGKPDEKISLGLNLRYLVDKFTDVLFVTLFVSLYFVSILTWDNDSENEVVADNAIASVEEEKPNTNSCFSREIKSITQINSIYYERNRSFTVEHMYTPEPSAERSIAESEVLTNLLTTDTESDSSYSRPNTAISSTTNSIPSTGYTSCSEPTTPFSPFTPTTFGELDKELSINQTNTTNIQNDLSKGKELKESLLEKLEEERSYLLSQKSKHFNSLWELAKRTEFKDVDSDKLSTEISKLKTDVDKLYKESQANAKRLDTIPEDNNSNNTSNGNTDNND